jgi:circadian clock protein KaiB
LGATGEEVETANNSRSQKEEQEKWKMSLYVAGQTSKSLQAFVNLKEICEENLKGRYSIEIIDLVKDPQVAARDQIFALPMLVFKWKGSTKRIIGNLSDTQHLRTILGLN